MVYVRLRPSNFAGGVLWTGGGTVSTRGTTAIGKGRSSVVGPIFRKECYAIAFPNGSPWRKPVNFALLKIKESGAYDALHDKWFNGPD